MSGATIIYADTEQAVQSLPGQGLMVSNKFAGAFDGMLWTI